MRRFDQAAVELTVGSRLGIDVTINVRAKASNLDSARPLIEMGESTRKKINALFGGN